MKYNTVIADALSRSGMTQKELAQRAGITQSYVSQICSGKKEPTLATLIALCDVLKIELNDLTEYSTARSRSVKLTSGENELLVLYRRMSRENQAFLTHIADTLARESR